MAPPFYNFLLLLLLLLPLPAQCTISDAYSRFLTKNYGHQVEAMIARRDLLTLGSFGGGNHVAEQRTGRRPICMVHGLSTIAGEYESLRSYFLTHGYRDEEVYATSYGTGPVNWTHDSMVCGHVKRFRYLIASVADFTSSQVDVIGYSMGSPIARKAILGGNCVDGGDYLGPSLTQLVHTFVGVAGANREAVHLCEVLNPVTGDAPCNKLTGMACHSAFLDNVNLAHIPHYEASRRIYTLYSYADEVVGYKDCDGNLVCSVPNQDFGLKLMLPHDHFQTIFLTAKQQLELINGDYEQKFNVSISFTNGFL